MGWCAIRSLALASIICLGAGGEADAGEEDRIAYLAHTGGYWQAWAMGTDGVDARQLTTSAVDKTRCSWYPDGDALLVSTHAGEVLRVDVASGREEKLPLPLSGMMDAALSPDGATIAFSLSPASSRDDNEIYVVRPDGTHLRKLTTEKGVQHQPTWSPDGAWIYFLSGDGKEVHGIWRLSWETGAREQITTGRRFHFDVAVAADGRLAFSNNHSGNYEIWVLDPKGEAQALTDHPAVDAYPAWSPEGESLIFESSRGGQLDLWRVSAEGGDSVRLTESAEGARRPVWWLPRGGEPR